jgi:uncharacterized protein (TIGR03032 family)
MGIAALDGPAISYMSLPHPSGLAVNRKSGVVHIASTRNPNQVYDLLPVTGLMPRLDVKSITLRDAPLIPVRSHFYPGCLYLHDMVLIKGDVYACAVGQNAIVHLCGDGHYVRVWWPRCVERDGEIAFGQNHIQLNSIAAGKDLGTSYFTASTDFISSRRPGHKNFSVDRRGVLFSGATREPVVRGLTRPHSARPHEGRVWLDNSGYGQVGYVDLKKGVFIPVAALPGWTRGLCFYKDIGFIGTSRVIPRFRQYAPGLDTERSLCGIHAIHTKSGEILGSLIWPYGNQVFAIEWVSSRVTTGFPFSAGVQRSSMREKLLFYAFQTLLSQVNKNE